MTLKRNTLIAFVLFAAFCSSEAQGRQSFADSSLLALQADMAILPIANYSERTEVHSVLLPRLHRDLAGVGISYITSDQLRPFLREHRIRSQGWVGKAAAATIAQQTGVKYLLLGSWDVLRTEPDPEIGFSLRVLELEHMTLLASVSVGAAGSDYDGAFGLGRITRLSELADRVMERAIDELFPLPEYRAPDKAYVGCYEIALIPLDNYSDTPQAGNILTNILLTALLAEGYFVVEPGFVRELGLVRGVVHRGGVDRASASAIRNNFNTCRVITGTVEKFVTARGLSSATVPSVAFGMRVMSPEDGNIYMMEELEGSGDDGELLFQLGRTHALVTLTNQVLERFLKDLIDNNREDILYGQHRR